MTEDSSGREKIKAGVGVATFEGIITSEGIAAGDWDVAKEG